MAQCNDAFLEMLEYTSRMLRYFGEECEVEELLKSYCVYNSHRFNFERDITAWQMDNLSRKYWFEFLFPRVKNFAIQKQYSLCYAYSTEKPDSIDVVLFFIWEAPHRIGGFYGATKPIKMQATQELPDAYLRCDGLPTRIYKRLKSVL